MSVNNKNKTRQMIGECFRCHGRKMCTIVDLPGKELTACEACLVYARLEAADGELMRAQWTVGNLREQLTIAQAQANQAKGFMAESASVVDSAQRGFKKLWDIVTVMSCALGFYANRDNFVSQIETNLGPPRVVVDLGGMARQALAAVTLDFGPQMFLTGTDLQLIDQFLTTVQNGEVTFVDTDLITIQVHENVPMWAEDLQGRVRRHLELVDAGRLTGDEQVPLQETGKDIDGGDVEREGSTTGNSDFSSTFTGKP